MARPERFHCPACGHANVERVIVERAGKKDYRTDFLACCKCRVMLWVPADKVKGYGVTWRPQGDD